MNKNIDLNQVLLIGIATVMLLLTAASFYLLQDPLAPLPFAALPSETRVSIQSSATQSAVETSTAVPTRQTSYTPFASLGTPTTVSTAEENLTPVATSAIPSVTPSTVTPIPRQPTSTSQAYPAPGTPSSQPTAGPTRTLAPTNPGSTAIPSASPTLMAGEHGVTGRILQEGTPLPNVVVTFFDDNPSRQATTNSGGHYWFTTLAPGTNFTLEFFSGDNPQVTPVAEVASLAWITGNLPVGGDTITLPDLDVSLNLEGMIFGLVTPVDGAAYSAAAINSNNPIQFTWTPYYQGEYYFIEFGNRSDDTLLWTSDTTTSSSIMWNGTLESGDHITQGSYWWHVGVKKTVGGYDVFVFTPNNDLLFNP